MRVDAPEFTRVYREFYPRVLAFAMRRTPSPEDAREVADETFLIAWQKRYRLPTKLLPWLLVTAKNTLMAGHRRNRTGLAVVAELARLTASSIEPPDDAIAERTVIFQALTSLPPGDQEALMLTAWDGLSNTQAARVMTVSGATFAVRLHRARNRFHQAMRQLERAAESRTATGRGRSDLPVLGETR